MGRELMKLAPGAARYVVACVVGKWVGLLATIFMMINIAQICADLLSGVMALPWGTFALIGLAACVRAVAGVLSEYAANKAALIAKTHIRQSLFDKLLALGVTYQEKVGTAEAMQLAVEGTEQLEIYFGAFVPQLIFSVFAPLTLFVVFAPMCLPAACVLVLGVPLIPVLIAGVRHAARMAAGVYWGSYSDLGKSFLEDIEGLTTLKIFQADAARHKRMNEQAHHFRCATMDLLRTQLRTIVVMDLIVFVGAAIGIVIAAFQLASGAIGFAAAFSVAFLSQEFFLPIRKLGSLFHAAMNGIAALDRMRDVLDAPAPESGKLDVLGSDATITVSDVNYSYDGRRQVLDGINAVFAQGSFCAIVGKSGCGKSTLAGILAGRLTEYTGSVEIGGHDVREFSLEACARAITTVPTNGMLFAGTVRDNLLLGNPQADDEQMWEVLRRCRIANWLATQTGLDTPIAEGASNLSGGQRQRLVLARALLHDSPIYLFDEATSNIDVQSEAIIGQVITELAEHRTVIVMSHRLSLVEGADEIFAIKDGRVAEHGTHAELLAAGGVYAALWQSQQYLESLAREFAEADRAAGEADEKAEVHWSDFVAKVKVDSMQQTRTAWCPEDALSEDAFMQDDEGSGTQGEREGGLFHAPPASSQEAASSKNSRTHRSSLSIMRRLFSLLSELKSYMALAIILGALGHLCAIALMSAGAYALACAAGALDASLVIICIVIVVCGLARGPLRYGEQLSNHYIAFSILAKIRDYVYFALRRLAPARLEGKSKGDLVSIATGDIELLEVFYAHTISPVAIAFIVAVVMVVWLALASLWLALIALVAYLIIGVVFSALGRRVSADAGHALRQGTGDLNAYVLESLRGLGELLQFGAAHERARELVKRTRKLGKVELCFRQSAARVAAVADIVIFAFDLAVLAVSIVLVAQHNLDFTQALVCTVAFMSSFGPIISVMNLGGALAGTLAAAERVLDLLDEKPQVFDMGSSGHIPCDGAFTPITAHQVSFSYDNTKLFWDVNFEVGKGKILALDGPSGSGKSTLLKLLMRFWDVAQGIISYNTTDVRLIPIKNLRCTIGYMTQDTHLFEGSIRDNIALARPDASEKELRLACAKAHILDFIDQLEHGFDTPVGELGDVMSQGERQRLGLARIFLQDAPILFLDEPTSKLDALNEAAIIDALRCECAGKTIIIVSHRASTTSFADFHYTLKAFEP